MLCLMRQRITLFFWKEYKLLLHSLQNYQLEDQLTLKIKQSCNHLLYLMLIQTEMSFFSLMKLVFVCVIADC